MGEIKSTLELVMEKTRHLTLSKEEKLEQMHTEADKRLKGLVQKYLDNALNKQQFDETLNRLRKTYGLAVDHILLVRLLEGLRLDKDNTPRLLLLNEFCGIDVTELESVFNGYQKTIRSVTQKRTKKLKKRLSGKRNISGSAVVPNLEIDKEWIDAAKDIHDTFEHTLGRKKTRLLKNVSNPTG